MFLKYVLALRNSRVALCMGPFLLKIKIEPGRIVSASVLFGRVTPNQYHHLVKNGYSQGQIIVEAGGCQATPRFSKFVIKYIESLTDFFLLCVLAPPL